MSTAAFLFLAGVLFWQGLRARESSRFWMFAGALFIAANSVTSYLTIWTPTIGWIIAALSLAAAYGLRRLTAR